MELFNLLSNEVGIALFGNTYDISLNWIGMLIRWLITGVGSVGIGIILFSIILKVIVLPFDVHQRISMRKQNLKMKENQARMEKLQKQYANDKDKYNQKVMEMYKESGISMFSSCLPMILSLIIFIVAINAFNAYSQYANVENYNDMVDAYNAKVESLCKDLETDEAFLRYDETQKVYFFDADKLYAKEEIKSFVDGATSADANKTKESAIKEYFMNEGQKAVVSAYETEVVKHTSFLWIKNIWATDASYKHPVLEFSEFKMEVERQNFQVGDKTAGFAGVAEYTNVYEEDTYKIITQQLTTQKKQANGYYILIVLSIGTILLQQWISMRGQKEQQKYSSVDGQGASQQKMTMIIMTGMFAIFSFMYSSAFSIYMIMSNVLSLISTIAINKLVDISERKKEEKALVEKYNKRFAYRTAQESGSKTQNKNKKNK
ncbi:MAG: membrane protein insertase YidC [Clostridia bacterium]|nr:membrane protein insertase YidC [Clostridia bacterium]